MSLFDSYQDYDVKHVSDGQKIGHLAGLKAISPLILFIILYVVTSCVTGDFYAMPLTVTFMIVSIYAIAITSGRPLSERLSAYHKGAGAGHLMLMLWIFVLAGAFSHTAKQMGCIDATVDLALMILPGEMIVAGMFVVSCLISFAVGTSVGTIVALMPMAVGIAQSVSGDMGLIAACVIGGAFFGDNLSFISDTTIAATSTQGCLPKDKFRANVSIVLPAAIVICVVYLILGADVQVPAQPQHIELLRVIPYFVVLISAIIGVNVLVCLTLGIVLCGIIGIWEGAYGLLEWFRVMGSGISGMSELIIITLMAGGLLEVIRINGGIRYILERLTAHVKGPRGAELSIAGLVCLVNICTANNTVAILIVGDISKEIGERFHVDSRKVASILDTFACSIQGVLPYGAQMLMAAGITGLTPIQIVPYLYYPFAIGIASLISIMFDYPRYSKKDGEIGSG
ncbi:MAG: Na+/H+ antiporter NhaC family protein [Proteobacteria bacterium]|nr:Na+/H+ antiporter NhaC family protein [Pseudomonadota bacterium]